MTFSIGRIEDFIEIHTIELKIATDNPVDCRKYLLLFAFSKQPDWLSSMLQRLKRAAAGPRNSPESELVQDVENCSF